MTRFQYSGAGRDIDDAITRYQEALDLLSPNQVGRGTVAFSLGLAFELRYAKFFVPRDVDDAISNYRESLRLRPPGHPARTKCLYQLFHALMRRHEQQGSADDLEEAISLGHELLSLLNHDQTHHPATLSGLLAALMSQHGQPESMDHYGELVSLAREAHLVDYDRSLRLPVLNNLAVALTCRYEQKASMDDLAEAISLCLEALKLLPPHGPERPPTLNSLAGALMRKYEGQGSIDDLEEAITLLREMIEILPPHDQNRLKALSNLVLAIKRRYDRLGSIGDMEESISLGRESLRLCPPGHPLRSSSLQNLALSVRSRYEQQGSKEDLEEVISLLRESLRCCPPHHPNRSLSFNNLAFALINRYEEQNSTEDLTEAIFFGHEALSLRPIGHPLRSWSFNCLAIAHQMRHSRLGSKKDLEYSISFHREAMKLTPVEHMYRSSDLYNLANVLRTRYTEEHSQNIADLEESIYLYRNAIKLRLPGHPGRSQYLHDLAVSLLFRFAHMGTRNDFKEAFQLFAQASCDVHSFVKHRLSSATVWIKFSRDFNDESVKPACKTALHLLQRSLISRGHVEAQQSYLATTQSAASLACESSSAIIPTGDLETAVELLEQGRAILWSKANVYKDPLQELRQANEGIELADRLESLNIQLEKIVLQSQRSIIQNKEASSSELLESQMQKHRILSEEWDETVEKIRKIDGFENFLQAPQFKQLQAAAVEGPVIIVNISSYRCDAIIILHHSPPVLVPLPQARSETLLDHATKLQSSREIVGVLRDIWRTIGHPVVERLSDIGIAQKSRIWWCPTSALCALPLHAAGPYRRGERNLPDIYISSYTPTLSALIRARSKISKSQGVPKLLVVGQSGKDLHRVKNEVDVIRRYEDNVDVLMDSEATRNAVLSGIMDHSRVHLACHGHLGDDNQPFRSSFELYNERLELLELIQAKLPHAELAFLSACHSAAGDTQTPDESIHLSAALQFCGFRSVVGTLWEMHDEDGPTIAKHFYDYIFSNGSTANFKESAQALNIAIREMRKQGVPLERWVMFVHTGA
ncbi:hypothetical protein JR316_0012774 [Psilocybe cubensis]|uniref:CHAT domain-containing protein n=2 Tax=Psilocybe cubensis TaxID=181762 RepID=A0A8H7XTB0_PSICU|nr:hypothetical protein JR316_0012774 [Psilocybe cubensis]KAH9474316.1 hypothetical protein JR316_0012774 [Psilocybe cubensis]